MPHIILIGCDINRQMKQVVIDVEVDFSHEAYCNYPKRKLRMDELEEKLGAVLKEYFDDYSVEQYTNHEYNLMKNNY